MRAPGREEVVALGLVAAGGALGAVSRDLVGQATGRGLVAVLLPNLVGALALGVLVEVLAAGPPTLARVRARLLVGTGFLGAFTTYSALAVGAVTTALDGRAALAVVYAVGTVVLGLLATGAGVALGGRHRRSRGAAPRRGG